MNNITQELDKLSKQIEDAKKNVAQYEGQGIQLMNQLKELGYKSVSEAEKDLEKMDKDISLKQTEIEKGFETLQKEYQW
jgi:hypothetical protein